MKGLYRIFKDGKEIAKSDNIVTEFGKDAMLKYLCGATNAWSDAVAIGISNTAATNLDTSMDLEISRAETSIQSPSIYQEVATGVNGTSAAYTITVPKANISGATNDIAVGMAVSGTNIGSGAIITAISGTSTYTVTLSKANSGTISSGTITFTARKAIIRASLPEDVAAYIYELGVFTSIQSLNSGGYDSNIITAFDEDIISGDTTTWLAGTGVSSVTGVPSSTNRAGLKNIRVTTGNATIIGSSSLTPTVPGNLNIDLTGYGINDTVKIMVHNASSTAGSFTITLYDNQDTPQSISWTESITNTIGSYIKKKKLADWTGIGGTFNFNVSAIKISSASAGTTLIFDALTIDNTDPTETTYGLVSRTVLSSPISKQAGESLDVQYELMLGI